MRVFHYHVLPGSSFGKPGYQVPSSFPTTSSACALEKKSACRGTKGKPPRIKQIPAQSQGSQLPKGRFFGWSPTTFLGFRSHDRFVWSPGLKARSEPFQLPRPIFRTDVLAEGRSFFTRQGKEAARSFL